MSRFRGGAASGELDPADPGAAPRDRLFPTRVVVRVFVVAGSVARAASGGFTTRPEKSRVDLKATIRWSPCDPGSGTTASRAAPGRSGLVGNGRAPRRERPPRRPRYSMFHQPGHLHRSEVDANGRKRATDPGSCVTTSGASRGRPANRTRRQCRRDLDLPVPDAGIVDFPFPAFRGTHPDARPARNCALQSCQDNSAVPVVE